VSGKGRNQAAQKGVFLVNMVAVFSSYNNSIKVYICTKSGHIPEAWRMTFFESEIVAQKKKKF